MLFIRLSLLLIVLPLVGCTQTSEQAFQAPDRPTVTAQPGTPEPNFAFIYRYRACGIDDTDVWDTAKGLFIATPLGSTTAVTIPLVARSDDLTQFYNQIQSIDFFSYPGEFRIPVESNQAMVMSAPAATYTLTVISGSRSHTVTWLDNIREPTTPEADRLRSVLDTIQVYLRARPEIEQLPEPQAACA